MFIIKYKILCCQTTTSFYKVTTHIMCPVEQERRCGSNNVPRKEKHTCHVWGPNPFKTKANCNSINKTYHQWKMWVMLNIVVSTQISLSYWTLSMKQGDRWYGYVWQRLSWWIQKCLLNVLPSQLQSQPVTLGFISKDIFSTLIAYVNLELFPIHMRTVSFSLFPSLYLINFIEKKSYIKKFQARGRRKFGYSYLHLKRELEFNDLRTYMLRKMTQKWIRKSISSKFTFKDIYSNWYLGE